MNMQISCTEVSEMQNVSIDVKVARTVPLAPPATLKQTASSSVLAISTP